MKFEITEVMEKLIMFILFLTETAFILSIIPFINSYVYSTPVVPLSDHPMNQSSLSPIVTDNFL
jgi:hypothetical protein